MPGFLERLFEGQAEAAKVIFRKGEDLAALVPHMPRHYIGVGIGYKKSAGEWTETLCVRFFVRRKIPMKLVPPSHVVDGVLWGLETDVVEVRPFAAKGVRNAQKAAAGKGAAMPAALLNGAGIGIQYISRAGSGPMGTAGAVLVDSAGTRYALSANHVLAQNGGPLKLPGFCVVNTGSQDSPVIPNPELIGSAVKFPLLRDGCTVDCAMVEAAGAATLRNVLPGYIKRAATEPVEAVLKAKVAKTGNGTGFTTGTVAGHANDIRVNCGPLGDVRISGAILIEDDGGQAGEGKVAFSRAGDSGSLIFQEDGQGKDGTGQWAPMGLLVAGPMDGAAAQPGSEGYSLACPASAVLAALGNEVPDRKPLYFAGFETL